MGRGIRELSIGWALGFALAWLATAWHGCGDTTAAWRATEELWAVREHGAEQTLWFDQELRPCTPLASEARRSPAVRLAEAAGRAQLVFPDGSRAAAPFASACLVAADSGGGLLVAARDGRVALRAPGVLGGVRALGTVPGRPGAAAPGPRPGTWWLHLWQRAPAVAATEASALALLQLVPGRELATLEVAWLRALDFSGAVHLAPIPGREEAWVVGAAARVALRVGARGAAEGRVELPMADAVGAGAAPSGALVVAFPGALVRWDPYGLPRRSRGGFDDLAALVRVQRPRGG